MSERVSYRLPTTDYRQSGNSVNADPLTYQSTDYSDTLSSIRSSDYSARTITATEARLAYNPRLDIEAFCKLEVLKDTLPQDQYQREQNSLLDLTKTNLITSLAERLNVEIYKTTYTQNGGHLYHGEFYPGIPFLEIVRRGQRIRESAGSQEVEREKAEVKGFEKVQELLAGDSLSEGAKVIVISPKGSGNSIYGHNFFDVYTKSTNGRITMSRYTSKATRQQFRGSAQELDPFSSIPENPTDADFLKNPIVTYRDVEEIKLVMNEDEKTLAISDFQSLLPSLMPQIDNILKNLRQNRDQSILNQQHQSLLKSTDIASGQDGQFSKERQAEILAQMSQNPAEIVQFLGNQPLREVKTGCGISGFTTPNLFSVSEFAKANQDKFGTLEIHCEECGAKYNRTPNKLEEKCKRCGGTKGIAC